MVEAYREAGTSCSLAWALEWVCTVILFHRVAGYACVDFSKRDPGTVGLGNVDMAFEPSLLRRKAVFGQRQGKELLLTPKHRAGADRGTGLVGACLLSFKRKGRGYYINLVTRAHDVGGGFISRTGADPGTCWCVFLFCFCFFQEKGGTEYIRSHEERMMTMMGYDPKGTSDPQDKCRSK